MIDKNNRIIITSCSKTKINGENIPAMSLYNGPAFKILRKHEFSPKNLYIISAKYGLISGDSPISYYDQKMTSKRAIELSKSISSKIINIVETNPDAEILVNLGKTYASSIADAESVLNNINATFAHGSIGERLHQLKKWLEK